MVYIVPQEYKCPECGHEQMIQPTGDEFSCPVCYGEFIRKHVPAMKRVIDFSGDTPDDKRARALDSLKVENRIKI